MDQQQTVPEADRDLIGQGNRLREDMEALETWAQSLNEDVLDINETTFEEASAYLDRVRSVLQKIRDSEAAIEEWLAQVWKDQEMSGAVTVEGVGTVEVKRGADRKEWDHDGAAKAVVHALIARKGGEMPGPFEVRDALLKAGYIGYWRKAGMQALGLNRDEFCTVVPGIRRVIIT